MSEKTSERNGKKWDVTKVDAKAVNAAFKAIHEAEAKVKKAEDAAEKARAEVSKLVITFLSEHGKPAELGADGKPEGEPTFPAFLSSVYGLKVQPVIRNSSAGQRTGFVKRWGDESELPSF